MNDTCFGINNEGQLVFDYYHEDTDTVDGANVYNGQNSTLWCNFREAFADEIQETYQKLRGDGLITYDILEEQFITKGSDKWSESIFNEDGEFKYVSMVKTDNDASNLPFARGDGEQHFRYFVENRLNYCDSKWYATDYANDYVSLRIYTPSEWAGVEPNADITVVPYSNMYAGVRYKANGTLYQERVEHGEEITFEAPDETFNDTETAIYGASQLSSLGDLAPLYCGTVNVAMATKLTEIKIGDGTEGYANNNLKELSVGTNKLLKKIDIQNCPSFTSALGLAGCQNIEEIYAKGSGITGVELADSGYLKIVQLPATIANLTMKNQEYIEEFSMEGYDALKTLQIENCPFIDTLTILDSATNIERVRLTGVDWEYDDASFLFELWDKNLAGIDENGANTDDMWIDGTCHIGTLTGAEMAELKTMFPYLTITYDTITSQLIFMSEDGQTELCRQTISNGGNGSNPAFNGTITIPTKQSTAQYNYAFTGWSLTSGGTADSNALLKVEADRYVYAAFDAILRSYTVNFYSGTTLLESHVVEYGSDATYTGDTPTNDSTGDTSDFEFIGWSPEPTNIQGDTNCYAQFYDTREIADDWTTIATNVLNETATSLYEIGSYKPVEITYEDGTSETIDMEVIAHNHDELSDGVKKWEYIETCPVTIYSYKGVHVIDNKLYVFTQGRVNIWDGSTWTTVTTTVSNAVYKGCLHDGEFYYCNGYLYKFDGTDYVQAAELPHTKEISNMISYNGCIHFFGSSSSAEVNNHYTWDGTTWTNLGAIYPGFGLFSIVYNNEIHTFGATKHCKFDGTSWTTLDDTTPFSGLTLMANTAVIHNDEIYVMTKTGVVYKYDGTEWSQVTTFPAYVSGYDAMCVYGGELHFIGSDNHKQHWKWSTASWVQIETTATSFYGAKTLIYNDIFYIKDKGGRWYKSGDGINFEQTTDYNLSLVTSEGDICLLGNELYFYQNTWTPSKDNYRKIYKYDFNEVTYVCDFPNTCSGPKLLVYNNQLHMLGGAYVGKDNNHYVWDGTQWTSVLGHNNCNGYVVYNNEIHGVVGTNHYKYDGNEWTRVGSTPKNTNKLTVLNDYIYGKFETTLYRFDGTEWSPILHSTKNMDTTVNYWYGDIFAYKQRLYLFGGLQTTANKLYVLENPKATLTFFAKNLLKDSRMMHSKSSDHAYPNMELRTWLANDLVNAMPTDLQNILKEVKKYSAGGFQHPIGALYLTTDKCFLLSDDELGSTSSGEGETYSVFTDNNSRVRTKVNGETIAWWTRSRYGANWSIFTVIENAGGFNYIGTNVANQRGVCFGFCI